MQAALPMADFHQSGAITTLHRLGAPGVERLERELLSYSRSRPIALVLPCLFSEVRGEGLKECRSRARFRREEIETKKGPEERWLFRAGLLF